MVHGVQWTDSLTVAPNFQNGFNVAGLRAFGAYTPTVISHDGNLTTCTVGPSTLTYFVTGGTLVNLGFQLTIASGPIATSGLLAPVDISLPSNCATTGSIFFTPVAFLSTTVSPGGSTGNSDTFQLLSTINDGFIRFYIRVSQGNSSSVTINNQTILISFSYLSVGF